MFNKQNFANCINGMISVFTLIEKWYIYKEILLLQSDKKTKEVEITNR